MFFYIQKIILNIMLPPSGPLLIILAGFLLLRTVYKRAGRLLVTAGIILLYLLSTSFISNLLIRPLENDYPPLRDIPAGDTAIVVLTAGARDLSHLGYGPSADHVSITRLLHAIELFRKADTGAVSLIISGGSGDPRKPTLSTGKALAQAARALGIPEDALVIEDTSRNTYESARELNARIKDDARTLILVTSAFHMKRSVSFFTKAGLRVIPAPTDYYGEPIPSFFQALIPSAKELGTSSTALYEYLVRLRYFIY